MGVLPTGRRRHRRNRHLFAPGASIRVLAITFAVALQASLSPPLRGQDVGRALVSVGDAGYQRGGSDKMLLRFKDRVRLQDFLLTGNPARLVVLLVDGQEVAMSDNAAVQLTPGEGYLRRGTIRVVCDPGPKPCACPNFVVLSGVAKTQAKCTGYVVSCGAPMTAPDACLMVGVYGLTEVTSFAAPDAPVQLLPGYFTEVRRGEPPDPPRKMEESRYFALIDSTTVVGSGSDQDRLEISLEAEADELAPDLDFRPHSEFGSLPITDVPVDPPCPMGPCPPEPDRVPPRF